MAATKPSTARRRFLYSAECNQWTERERASLCVLRERGRSERHSLPYLGEGEGEGEGWQEREAQLGTP